MVAVGDDQRALAGATSSARSTSSFSGISVLPGSAAISCSPGVRTSRRYTGSPAFSFRKSSFTEICWTMALLAIPPGAAP